MSLYAEYLKEKTNDEILETEKGFASFRWILDSVYIVDIYVIPEARKTGEARRMADAIASAAKDRGCKKIIGSVIPSAKHSTESLKVLIAYGMKLVSSSADFIAFEKEI